MPTWQGYFLLGQMESHMAKHLWEVEHPYYCERSNFYGGKDPVENFDSWDDFISNGDSDRNFGRNLLFRWDWQKADRDNEQPTDLLLLFWMNQRKGIYYWTEIVIKDDDEDSVREWLNKRFEYLKKIWEPLT
jgi:hypothetical protein